MKSQIQIPEDTIRGHWFKHTTGLRRQIGRTKKIELAYAPLKGCKARSLLKKRLG